MQKRLKMKTNKTSALLILGGIIAAIGLTACTADSDISEQVSQPTNSNYPISDVHAVESGIVSVQFNKNALTRSDVNELRPEDIVITPVTEAQAKSFDQTRFDDSGSSIAYMYAWTTLNYRCKTADGSEKDLSELVVWPYTWVNWEPNQLVIGCHSTITSDAQRPTNFANLPSAGEINMLALFAHAFSQEALVVIPDYEGYGITASSHHPYCNRELTAEQVVTGAKAALAYFEKNVTSMEDDWSGVAIGYSQGGAVAAGVLRYCQEHNETSLRLKGAVCGDGPYDPQATLKRYIDMDQLYMPVAPAMLLKGAIDTDPDMIAAQCQYQDFVTDKFYDTGIFKLIESKQNTTDDIQAALLKYSYDHGDDGGFVMRALTSDEGFLPYTKNNAVSPSGKERSFELENGKGYNYCTVDQCLKPGVIAYFRDGTITGDVPEAKLKVLEKALTKNALTADGFMPGNGFTFFHSVGDEVVPYCNFEHVRNTWGVGNIVALSYQTSTTLHVGTGTAFFVRYCGGLVDEILDGKWTPREQTIDGGLWRGKDVR